MDDVGKIDIMVYKQYSLIYKEIQIVESIEMED